MQREQAAADVVIVGAGPCGLAAAVAAQRAGLSATIIERECVVSGIASYPTFMTFFSTADRLSIGDIPFIVATEKPTRRDALAYYRAIVEHFNLDVRQYETVVRVERLDGVAGGPPPNSKIRKTPNSSGINSAQLPPRYRVHSIRRAGDKRMTDCHAVVIATGYFGAPNRLGVPGEDLPHVTHLYREGHEAFRQDAVVVGGGNSAVEAALDLHRCGARVTLVHFGPTFDRNIKPWIRPTIESRMAAGEIGVRWNATVERIDPACVWLKTEQGPECIPAEHVYLMIGYMPEVELLEGLEVPIDPETGIPAHDPTTMETPLPGVFIAGVIASGYDANKTFIENGRHHGELIARRIVAEADAAANPSPS